MVYSILNLFLEGESLPQKLVIGPLARAFALHIAIAWHTPPKKKKKLGCKYGEGLQGTKTNLIFFYSFHHSCDAFRMSIDSPLLAWNRY